MSESKDLADGWWPVESKSDWIVCPHCGSGDVDLKHTSPWDEKRPKVDCNNCEANGYFD